MEFNLPETMQVHTTAADVVASIFLCLGLFGKLPQLFNPRSKTNEKANTNYGILAISIYLHIVARKLCNQLEIV